MEEYTALLNELSVVIAKIERGLHEHDDVLIVIQQIDDFLTGLSEIQTGHPDLAEIQEIIHNLMIMKPDL